MACDLKGLIGLLNMKRFLRGLVSSSMLYVFSQGYTLHAKDVYIDNLVGSDAYSGLSEKVNGEDGPVRTTDKAMSLLQAGDRLHFINTGKWYHQTLSTYGHKGGLPEKPIVIDGRGVTLCGADPVSADEWKPYAGDTQMRRDELSKGITVIDGALVKMTRTFDLLEEGELCFMPKYYKRLYFRLPKGHSMKDYHIEVQNDSGEWLSLNPKKFSRSHSRIKGVLRYQGLDSVKAFRVNGQMVEGVLARDRLKPGQWTQQDGQMYFRPVAGKTLADYQFEAMVRGNGIMLNGQQSHFVFKNFNVTKVYNDGYNIHGQVTDASFYNCNAHQVGDEGFSSHDTCETLLDGAVYVDCDNGIANVNACRSVTKNVLIARSRNVGFLITTKPDVKHVLENAILVDNPTQIAGGNIDIDNVLVVQDRHKNAVAFSASKHGMALKAKAVTVQGGGTLLYTTRDGRLELSQALIQADKIHIRKNQPETHLWLESSTIASDLTLEYGKKHPFLKTSWHELPSYGHVKSMSPELASALQAREVHVNEFGRGCSKALFERYLDFAKK